VKAMMVMLGLVLTSVVPTRNGALARDGARVGGWRPRGSPVDPGNLAGPMTELLA
jgi:hypothetical protein